MYIKYYAKKGISLLLAAAMLLSLLIGHGAMFASAAPPPIPNYDAYVTQTQLGYDPNTTAGTAYTDVTLNSGDGIYTINTSGQYRITGGTAAAPISGVAIHITGNIEVDLILKDLHIVNYDNGYTTALNFGIAETGAGTTGFSPMVISDHAKTWITLENDNRLENKDADKAIINAGISITVSSSVIFTERSNGGSLTAIAGRCAAAIGGYHDTKSGFIMINGGTITAIADKPNGYAAIGGGHYNTADGSWCPGIVINGGNIYASGGNVGIGMWYGKGTTTTGYAAAYSGQLSFIEINGGTIYADNNAFAGTDYRAGAAIGFVVENDITPVHINGGTITAAQYGYGAGIGGGGTDSGTGGSGGIALYEGGTVVVTAASGVGMGGGASNTGTSNIEDGTVTVTGGNIFTDIASIVAGDNTQHAWTLPDTSVNTTAKAIKIKVAIGEVGEKIGQVAFKYMSTVSSQDEWYYNYGVEDTFVTTTNSTEGEVWVWVPQSFKLTYDLTSGRSTSAYTNSDFNITHANRKAAGNTFATIASNSNNYYYPGEEKTLLTWDENIDTNATYDGATWGAIASGANYHTMGKQLYQLAEHDPVGGHDVYLIGWAKDPVMDNGVEHIFALEDGWDYKNYVEDTAPFSNADITVYAVWGYDENGNGIPDVRDFGYSLAYDANGGTNAPTNSMSYMSGDSAPISHSQPSYSGHVFMGWTDDPAFGGVTLGADGALPPAANLYIGGTGNTGTISFPDGSSVTGATDVTFASANIKLFALWGVDSNGNGTPDMLEPVRNLIHDGNGAASGTPANKPYVDGNTGVSDTGAVMVYPNATYGNNNVLIGWTEDASVSGMVFQNGDLSLLPADMDDPITLGTPFSGSDMTVYAVWGEDSNNNGTADVLEGTYRFLYNPSTSDTVNGVPTDSKNYLPNDSVDPANDSYIDITVAPGVMSPYMERSGWVILGWTDDDAATMEYDVAAAATYNAANGVYPNNDPSLYLSSVTSMAFTDSDIEIYAVWGVDSNGNGIPDWSDDPGRKILYSPGLGSSVSSLDQATMPFYDTGNPGIYEDDKGGTTYNVGDVATLSSAVPQADGFVFFGWSPIYVSGTVFSLDIGQPGLDDFYTLLCLLEDIPVGGYASGANVISGGSQYAQVTYDIKSGLEQNYAAAVAVATPTVPAQPLSDHYGDFNWVSNYSGQGFLSAVTFDAFTSDMADVGGDAYSQTWHMYGTWGVDSNRNGIADIFEDTYTLYYDFNGGSGGPSNKPFNLPGNTVRLDTVNAPAKLDSSNNDMKFLGWTTDASVKGYYKAGEAAQVPQTSGGVTFGNFDVTVYAVWAEDLNNNDIPDVYEDGFRLTYDPNGGSGAPIDSNHYQYGETVSVATTPVPTNGSHIFLYWTDDAGVAAVYGQGDRPNLPAQVTSVAFTNSNVTLYAVWGEDANGNGTPDVNEGDYSLSYDANGGIDPPTDSTAYGWNNTVNLDSGSGMTNGNYVLVGWTLEDPSTYSSVYTFGEANLLPQLATSVTFTSTDITAYAVWSTDNNGNGIPDVNEGGPVILRFDLNGGSTTSNAFDDRQLAPGQAITLPAERPTPPSGMVLSGWSDGTNIYQPGESFKMPPSGDVTLQAQYVSASTTYTVTYDANGGTGSQVDGNSPYTVGSTVKVLGKNDMAKKGYTFLGWNTKTTGTGTAYAPNDTFVITADTVLYAQWKPSSSGGGGGGGSSSYTVTYQANGGSGSHMARGIKSGAAHVILSLSDTKISYSGHSFASWNTKADGSGKDYKPGDTLTVTGSMSLYAQWDTGEKAKPPADSLEKDKHILYLYGYPDGSVRGDGNITRAEASAIFFRLLSDKVHPNKNTAVGGQFGDISGGEWFAQSVNYLASIGAVTGYPDGTFRPNQQITRAEFAAIAAQFDELDYTSENMFSDVSGSHWAVSYINAAYDKGWINGYTDGTFRSDQYITRGETVTIVNKMLDRAIDDKALAEIKNPYNDIAPAHWAYAAIIEASIAHQYSRDNDGVEHWINQ